MGDDKLKQELFYMVRLTSKYDFTRMEVVEGILRLENERRILDSVFGRRFKSRIFDIAAGVNKDNSCVLCGQIAENSVICSHCMETIGGSDYAKSHSPQKPENKNRFKINIPIKEILGNVLKSFQAKKKSEVSSTPEAIIKESNLTTNKLHLKSILQGVAIVCLALILLFQIWVFALWQEILSVNPTEKAMVSDNSTVAVADVDEAMSQLALDFPEEKGYTLSFARMDTDYVGRFRLEKGACCEETEEALKDEERYDYFFTEDVYVFYISYNEDDAFKLGVAEVNDDGAILVMGSFNDGRNTGYHYKYR